jgi:phosphatidylserine/phosphatidylglycerophosphate/cardiolipin synthase-like enzyme
MAKFLDTTGVSYHLQQLINKADEKLVLISPFLKINDRIKQSLEDKNRMKIDIRVVYGKNELQPEENNWLKSMTSIRSSFCKDLHAKCYLNEKEAIITSMNLYEFSQVNNNEMGIYVSKEEDSQLYKEIFEEVQRLIRISDEIVVSVEKAQTRNTEKPPTGNKGNKVEIKHISTTALSKEMKLSSKDLFSKLEQIKFIKKAGEDWVLTDLGRSYGGQMRNGQYGEYIAWPDTLAEFLLSGRQVI